MNEFNPILGKQRIASLDIMRGIAILGIFLVNMISFHSPFLYIEPFTWWESGIDRTFYIIIDIFVQANFYPLFSMLFGYGLMQLINRAIQRQGRFFAFALRRLFVLLVFGMIHAFFIWHGDILITYAVCGMLMLVFVRLSGKALIFIGSISYTVINIIIGILITLAVLFSQSGEFSIQNTDLALASLEIYKNGSFAEITHQRIEDWRYVNDSISGFFIIITILPLLLIGAGAAKYDLFRRIITHKKMLKSTLFISLIIGFSLKVLPYVLANNPATEYFQDIFGGPLLAVSIALFIALISEKSLGVNALSLFAAVGRLSISNYLFQSILATFLFYSYGLGLYGDISLFSGTLLAIFIFLFQVIMSKWYIRKFQYGPVEWVWRSITYLKWQRLVK